MATVILVRHGRTTANASGILAGGTPGVRLDETGAAQAARTGERLAVVPLVAVVTSPLERCRQTTKAILAAQPGSLRPSTERGITECDYGEWQGRPLKELAKEKLWSTVQAQPSAVTFPGGESMVGDAGPGGVRRTPSRRALEAEHGAGAVWVAVSHGDLIKSILADALGMHLDLFQRLHVDPASVSIVRYTGHPALRPGDQHPLRRPGLAGSAARPQGLPAQGLRRRRGRRWRRPFGHPLG